MAVALIFLAISGSVFGYLWSLNMNISTSGPKNDDYQNWFVSFWFGFYRACAEFRLSNSKHRPPTGEC